MEDPENATIAPTQALDEAFLVKMRAELGPIKIIEKEHDVLSHAIAKALFILTLGAQNSYISAYTTVLGHRIYVPKGWHDWSAQSRYLTLRHEIIHIRQFKKFTWPGMILLYGMVFPVGLAFGRAWLEWQAYKETIIATFELYGLEAVEDTRFQEHIVEQFASGAYGWMWPFPRHVRSMIQDVVAQLDALSKCSSERDIGT